MALGVVLEVFDLTAAVMASILVMFVYIELGSPYTWLVWLTTSLLAFVLYPGSLMWLVYLTIFGIYPILKGYIERLPRPWWLILKLVFLNTMLTLLVLLSKPIFGLPFFGEVEAFGIIPVEVVYCAMWLVMNVAFLLYDRLIIVMLAFYEYKIRPKIKSFLK